MARPKSVRRRVSRTAVTDVTYRGLQSFSKAPRGENEEFLFLAGQEIAKAARGIAAGFSRRIPVATGVYGDSYGVAVVTDAVIAPNGAPFEFAERHPLFGDRDYWYAQPRRPYMTEGAAVAAGAALEEYARILDPMTERAGYR